MKKAGKIALGVVGVLILAGAVTAAWQWNNVKAAAYMLTMDKSTLDTKLEENRQTLDNAMQQYHIPEYTFSQEEIDQLTDGSLTAEEAAARLLEEPQQSAAPEAQNEDGSAQTQASAAPSAPAATAPVSGGSTAEEEEIRQLIATMYVLQATYVGKLEAIVQDAIDEYTAGAHTDENRTKIVYSKYEELTALEQECDSKVSAVVSRLRELLKATGQDDSLAKEVENTYQEEKSLKKAYYIREFQEG